MRILIADDWPNVQSALRVLLEQQPGLNPVGQAVDAGELLSRIESDCPDAVLLGWELPGAGGAELLHALRCACPDTSVIVLSGRPDAQRAALNAGADAFVSKVAPPERLLDALLSVRQAPRRAKRSDGSDPAVQRPSTARGPGSGPGRSDGLPAEGSRRNAVEDEREQRTSDHLPTCRRSTVIQTDKKRKDTLKYVAIIAVALVLLGCIAAGLTVSLVLIDEIPFQHIFPL